MKITFKNKLQWKKTYLVLLDKNYKEVRTILLNETIYEHDIDLDTVRFCYVTNEKIKSNIVILSQNNSVLVFSYCKKTKKYKADIENKDIVEYGKVSTYYLKDDTNLYYRNDKSKKIDVYVPSNYNKSKTYKLLVMFDSQNIFNKKIVGRYTKNNDPYGGWQVETSIENINDDYIIVGIDNADNYREKELTAKTNDENIKELLSRTLDIKDNFYLDNIDSFTKDTLFPFLSKKYNIDFANMSIAGASCGGFASLYIGLKNTSMYNFIYCFTPSFGMLGKENIEKIISKFDLKSKDYLPFVFIFQGVGDDLEKMLYGGNKHLKSILLKEGYSENEVYEYIEKTAMHNEDYWRYAFNFATYMMNEQNKIKKLYK